MRYAWIERHRDDYQVARMCRQLEVSRTGYLQWRRRATERPRDGQCGAGRTSSGDSCRDAAKLWSTAHRARVAGARYCRRS